MGKKELWEGKKGDSGLELACNIFRIYTHVVCLGATLDLVVLNAEFA